MITFEAMQKRFEQAFLEERQDPRSITIAEADYVAFVQSLFPDEERRVVQVLNRTTGHLVSLMQSPTLSPGTIVLGE